MTRAEAQQALLLYRPGTTDAADDPQLGEALELARHDAELERWFDGHRAFQRAMRAKFRQIDVPAHLKTSLLIQVAAPRKPIVVHPWWHRPVWLGAVAAVALLAGLVGVLRMPRTPDRFAHYEARVVSEAQREYRMDVVTHDMDQVRQFMARRGAPADYHLPQGLQRLQLTGGGLLTWRSHPVAMVCFERADKQMLFLFVLKRSAVKDPPPETPRLAKVREMATASWTRGDNTYVLAGPEEADFARKYL